MNSVDFKAAILQGIPQQLPPVKPYNVNVNHAPKRKDILTKKEKKLALKNALRYFPKELHKELAPEFLDELKEYGRIYMYRFMPDYTM
ncbi:MAG: urocanate hydratase, partial [Draconibacterium sp.]|nr:urocanate hydratase [Draconibacterium sp.]